MERLRELEDEIRDHARSVDEASGWAERLREIREELEADTNKVREKLDEALALIRKEREG